MNSIPKTCPVSMDVDDPDLGSIWVPGPVIEARDLEPADLPSAPHPGEHTHLVLKEVLGLASEELADLENQKIIAGPPDSLGLTG